MQGHALFHPPGDRNSILHARITAPCKHWQCPLAAALDRASAHYMAGWRRLPLPRRSTSQVALTTSWLWLMICPVDGHAASSGTSLHDAHLQQMKYIWPVLRPLMCICSGLRPAQRHPSKTSMAATLVRANSLTFGSEHSGLMLRSLCSAVHPCHDMNCLRVHRPIWQRPGLHPLCRHAGGAGAPPATR